MAKFPSLPFYTDAYFGDTIHLTTTEHGAYLLLLFTAWGSKDLRLPDDDARLARYCRLSKTQWTRMRPTIQEFWRVENGFWSNDRLCDEHDAVKRNVQQRSDAGKASALKRKHRDSTGVEIPFNENPTPIPIPIPIEESVPNGTDAEASFSIKKSLFNGGLDWLASASGKPADKLRPLVGKWCRDYGDGAVVFALDQACKQAAVDPVGYITKILDGGQMPDLDAIFGENE